MSRILNFASILILITTIAAMTLGLTELFTKETLEEQFSGFYLFGAGMFFTPIVLIPFRKGEKWAWYTALITGGIALIGQTILLHNAVSAMDAIYLPSSIVLVLLWVVGIALSAKEALS